MSDKDDEEIISDEEALEVGAAALFTAIGEGAKVVVPAVAASVGWQAILAVTLPLLGFAVAKGAYRLFAPRTAMLAKGFTAAFGGDPERVREHAEQHRDDANYQETMFRAFRAMMDAAEPEVVEALGYMAGRYTLASKRPDFLFRCIGRLLCDLEQGELGQFRKLLRRVHRAQKPDAKWVSMQFESTRADWGEPTNPPKPHKVLTTYGASKTELGPHPEAERLFVLLKRDGLASTPSALEAADKSSTEPEGDHVLEMPMATLVAILEVIDAEPAAAPPR